jgi:hypothetical protein
MCGARRSVFVVVFVVRCVPASVVDVIDVIAMRDRDMPTTIPMNMVVAGVLSVRFLSHRSFATVRDLLPPCSTGS